MYAISSNIIISSGPIANNGLIVSGEDELRLECVSNSSQPGVGSITTPSGLILSPDMDSGIWKLINPFNRPGLLRFRTLDHRNLTNDDMGVYTCMIPDDNGNIISLNLGIYPNSSEGYSQVVLCIVQSILISLS